LKEAGITVVGISYDSVEVLAQAARKHDLQMPLLSDPVSQVIEVYGLKNPDASGRTAGVPYPMTVIVDGSGIVRAKLAQEGYRTRHTTDDLLKAVGGIANGAAGKE